MALSLALTTALPLAAASTASAAPADKPIRVTLDSKELKFNVMPVNLEGTVYVEFKPLFQALGFEVSYDSNTKVVTGLSDDVIIEMQLNTTNSYINGEAPEKPAKAISHSGRTLVPLRFISEAAGLDVKWDAKSKLVKISHYTLSTGQLKAIDTFFAKEKAASDSRNAAAYVALYDSASPYYDSMKELTSYYIPTSAKTTEEISNVQVVKFNGKQATITYTSTKTKAGDDFFLDELNDMRAVLTLQKDGSWLLYHSIVLTTEYPTADEVLTKEANVPDAEKQAILAAVDTYFSALNKENLEEAVALLDPKSPLTPYLEYQFAQDFTDYDLRSTLEKTTIVSYSDKTAFVYNVYTDEDSSDPDYPGSRIYELNKLIKDTSGKWLLDPNNVIINIEDL